MNSEKEFSIAIIVLVVLFGVFFYSCMDDKQQEIEELKISYEELRYEYGELESKYDELKSNYESYEENSNDYSFEEEYEWLD